MSPKNSSDAKDLPKLSPEGERAQAARRAREAEALRANLLKRKAQARGRQAASEGDSGPRATAPTHPRRT